MATCQGRTWQPGPIPLLQRGAGQLRGSGAAPAPGIGHFPEDRQWSGLGPGQEGPQPGRAGGRWTLAGAAVGVWAVGGMGEGLGSRGADQDH